MTSFSRETQRQQRIDEYFQRLPIEKRKQLEQASLASAGGPMREALERARHHDESLLINLYRWLILEEHVAGMLEDSTRRR